MPDQPAPTVSDAQHAAHWAAIYATVAAVTTVAAVSWWAPDTPGWRLVAAVAFVAAIAACVQWARAQQTAIEAGYWFHGSRDLRRLFAADAVFAAVVLVAVWDVSSPVWRALAAFAVVAFIGWVMAAPAPPKKPVR